MANLRDYFTLPGVIFGFVLGLVSFYLGSIIEQIVRILDTIASWILEALLFMLKLPVLVAGKLPVKGNMILITALIVGVLIGPLIYRIFKALLDALKKIPV